MTGLIKTVAFTGHRPNKLGGYAATNPMRDAVLWRLLFKLRELRPERAISGMAQGVDQWAAECCIHLGIPWTAAVPFEGQESLWPPVQKAKYRWLLGHASHVEVVCGANVEPVKAMQVRNEWMVDRADTLIAVWDGTRGGTANCVRYANLMKVPVVRIDPSEL